MSGQSPDADGDADGAESATETPENTARVEVPTDTLKHALDALTAAFNEAVFVFRDDGFEANVVDPARVLMADVSIDADECVHYESTGVRFGINVERLRDMALAGDTARIVWDPDEWVVHVESGPVEGTISPLDPSSIPTQDPDDGVWDNAQARMTVTREDFVTALVAIDSIRGKVVSVHVDTEDSPEATAWLARAGDSDDVSADLYPEMHDWPDEPARAYMSTEYLDRVKMALSTDVEDIAVWVGTDWPMVMEYHVHGADVTFIEAPRLDK